MKVCLCFLGVGGGLSGGVRVGGAPRGKSVRLTLGYEFSLCAKSHSAYYSYLLNLISLLLIIS
jgi:hypothetical protein